MTTPDAFQGRPVPDVADLRLLAEIINSGAVGLPQAAWNAGMSQSEAAARLVTMAERGMPLRLVAEGDRQLLWQIAQAGPVPPFPPAPSSPTPPAADPAPTTGPIAAVQPDTSAPESDADSSSVWGVPGSSDWVRPPEEHPAAVSPAGTESVVESEVASDADSPAAEATAPSRRVLTSGQPVQAVEGLFGEQLDVGLQQILDPADTILTAVGYRIDAAERALLVRTSVGNRGPADYESPADLYLEVVDATGAVLPKAAMSVNGYPAHQVGVPANTLVSGWTVFLVPVDAEVAQVRWSIRPDLAHRTITWGFGPAPVDQW